MHLKVKTAPTTKGNITDVRSWGVPGLMAAFQKIRGSGTKKKEKKNTIWQQWLGSKKLVIKCLMPFLG